MIREGLGDITKTKAEFDSTLELEVGSVWSRMYLEL
jgi:hypothetical protein